MHFYEILQEIMNEQSLSITDVARMTGLADSTIRSIINRKTKTISLEVAFKLSKGLNVSLERLNGEKLQQQLNSKQEDTQFIEQEYIEMAKKLKKQNVKYEEIEKTIKILNILKN